MDRLFIEALPIIRKLKEHNYQAYFVGGAVRDHLLERSIGDVDIATSAKPDEIQQLFPSTVDVGANHGTIIVLYKNNSYEVTTFRTETGYKDYRRPAEVAFIHSLVEDLKRRDFTINAMAMDDKGKILDYFEGKKHLLEKRIMTVGNPHERFSEDALRMLRALRFMSSLDFQLDYKTEQAIKENFFLLEHISVERKTAEFVKLLSGKSPQAAISKMLETNVFKCLPFLEQKSGGLKTLSNLEFRHLQTSAEYWTLLIRVLNIINIEAFLRGWKLSVKIIQHVKNNNEVLTKVLSRGWSKKLVYQAGLNQSLQIERVYQALKNSKSQESFKLIEQIYEELPIKNREEIDLSGHEIISIMNKKPGPWVAEILCRIEEKIIYGSLDNSNKAIKEWLESCKQK
ncbi:CCA tRNA nucleotidyltransferase [Metabacillus arenae]|uniref:CCA-adding enzyme n=1 Tax=Metabacillus arenae TaxID=2771434 RepID=A0A926RXA9_9BACI|nr:CCA tRNA nucleotidyltransferase [Metabacillus arenae]MBD1381678.1 CCA tRNA nucleotidyltransferase [Metabacillus arenae]